MRTPRIPRPQELQAAMDQHVFGQTRAKQSLALGLYRAALSVASGSNAFGASHLLMVGPTGVGKTALVRVAAEHLRRPFFTVDCSSLVPAGIVGATLQSTLSALITFCGSRERAEKVILFLDEFDKLGDGTALERGREVQASLLPLLDSSSLEVGFASRTDDAARVRFATRDIIIVCAGAFTGLDAVVAKRIAGGAAIGFRGAPSRRTQRRTPLAGLEPTDLTALGFMPELLGRLRSVVTLDPLSSRDLEAILDMPSPSAALEQAKRWFAAHGTALTLDAGAKKAIAKRALARGLGARALQSILTEVLAPLEETVCNSDRIIERVVVTRATVTRGTPAVLHYSDDPDRRHHQSEAYKLRARAAVPPSISTDNDASNTVDWNRERLLERLDTLRDKLELGKAPIAVRHFWRDREAASLHQAVSTAEELLARGLFVEHLFFAERATGSYIPAVNLAYLDYMRVANRLPLVGHLRSEPQRNEPLPPGANDDAKDIEDW